MNLEELKKCKYGLTHNGTFHADDVFSTAFVKILNPNIQIIRASSVPKDFVGLVYDIGDGLFDHHGLSEYRNNQIPYAAFGKLWRNFAPQVYDDYIVEAIDKKFISLLDLSDNTGSKDSLCIAISALNPNDNSSGDKEFSEAVSIASIFLTKLIEQEKNIFLEELKVQKVYEKSQNKEIIILDDHLHFTNLLPKTKAIYVIFPSKRGGYSAQGVPINSDTVELKKPFPKKWLTSLPDYLTFCHKNRFLISADSLDKIVYACNIALKEVEK